MYLACLIATALLIAIYCLLLFTRRVLYYQKGTRGDSLPKVTMVFLLKNQESVIEGLIRKLYADTCLTSLEVVAVDLGSVDQTRMILERLTETFPEVYCLLSQDEPETLKRVYDLCRGTTIYCFDLTNTIDYGLMSRTIHSILHGSNACLYRTKVMYRQNISRPDPI